MSTRSQVRAKFRCMSVANTWDGGVEVRLLPVTAGKNQNDPDEAEENLAFWQATPNGEMELLYVAKYPPTVEFVPDACYYLDFIPTDETETTGKQNWRMTKTTFYDRPHSYEFELRYSCGPQRGDLKFSVDYDVTRAPEAFGEPADGLWKIELTPAG